MSIITEALKKAQKNRLVVEADETLVDFDNVLADKAFTSYDKKNGVKPGKKLSNSFSPLFFLLFSVIVFSGGIFFIWFTDNGAELFRPGIKSASSVNYVNTKNIGDITGKTFLPEQREIKVDPALQGKEPEDQNSLPVLNGIMFYSDDPKAVINGSIVSSGSTIGQYRIIKILPDAVELEDGSKKYLLELR
jgi:hypothetical protein